MSSSPSQPSLRDGELQAHRIYSNSSYEASVIDFSNNKDLENFEFGLQNLEGLPGFHDSINQRHGAANTFDQSYMPNLNFKNQGSILQAHHDSHVSLQHATCNDAAFLRGIKSHAEVSGPNDRHNEENRKETSSSAAARDCMPAPMQSSPPPHLSSTNNVPTTHSRQTRYNAFGRRFRGSEDAKRYRHINTRFNRQPYIAPSQDLTIMSIEAEREFHVERIYNAMTSSESARDNHGSIAMKRWVHAAHYPANLVEAYAHKVLDCVLAQAKDGFRGWHHNDYVVDDRKGEDEDRDVNCEERLDNVIRALEEEKTICEDVMNSACQIRMFVNAPRAYANRKYQNRVGNSKRGRAKDVAEASSRSSKMRRTGGRQCRTRSTVIPVSATEQRALRSLSQSQEPDLPSYEMISSSQHDTPHLSQDFMSPLQGSGMPAPHPFFVQTKANLISPSSPNSGLQQAPQISIQSARMTSMPPPHDSPFLSPPALSHTVYSAPVTPLEADPIPAVAGWQPSNPFLETCKTGTPQPPPSTSDLGFSQNWPWPDINTSTLPDAYIGANLFDQCHSADGTFASLAQPPDIKDQAPDFQTLWESHPGVQPFPFPDPSGNGVAH